MPRISVLMPVYNGILYIQEAVESVLAQEDDWELLISDDGSIDGTRDYLKTLSEHRIRLYFQERNLGIFGNLNFLLAQAKAPIAKILGQDDKLLPKALVRTLTFMEERPWCAVSRCLSIGDNQKYRFDPRWKLEGELPTRIYPAASWLVFATFGNIVGNICKATCRPQLVLAEGGFDQSFPYAGDYEGWMRIAGSHGIALQNEELVHEGRHENQNSNLLNRKNELYPQLTKLIEMLAAKVSQYDLSLLKRRWTICLFAPRLPRFARQVIAGKYRLAKSVLSDLPLGISPISVIVAYPIFKFNLFPVRVVTRKLFDRIIQLNSQTN